MTRPADPITEEDFQSYIDDEIDVARRIEVEAHLSARPEIAARVMADLRNRDELRLALAGTPKVRRLATTDAARRLENGLRRGRMLRLMRRAAAVAALLAVGWFAHAQFGPLGIGEVVASTPAPSYVDDAVMAHRTLTLRDGMRSQPLAPDFDPDEIRSATAIVVPQLPKGWRVANVQIFPSKFGPSVEMALRTEAFGPVSLFAVRPGLFDVVSPTVIPKDGLNAAYWQIGDVAYALVADAKSEALDQAAAGLARSLY